MSGFAQNIVASLDRARDRAIRNPGDIRHAAGDRPGWTDALPLALQQIALQSTYWILPVIIGHMFGMSAAATAAFLGASLLVTAFGVALQGATRGWVGSGYAMPFVPNPVALSVYAGAAALGTGLGSAGATLIIASLVVSALFLAFPRVLQLISAEITGVVAFAIGISFLPKILEFLNRAIDTKAEAFRWSERNSDNVLASFDAEHAAILVFGVILALVIFIGIARWRLSAHAIIIGVVLGTVLGLALLGPDPVALAAFHDASWFKLPSMQLPDFGSLNLALLITAFVILLCGTADQLGDLLVMQREQDAAWSKPDTPPLRRGVLASNLTTTFAGLMGGMAAGTSSACVALAIATRSFSRRVACFGAALIVIVACSPKVISVFLLIPNPVIAALLLYVSAFMMGSGAKLITGRVLDARRTSCVGLGLAFGIATLFAHEFLARYLPEAIISPVVLAFIAAFSLHLLTLPLVRQVATTDIKLGAALGVDIDHFIEAAAGDWGLRRKTADSIRHAILEVAELVAARGASGVNVKASVTDGNVLVVIQHPAPILPAPALRPSVDDLENDAGMEAFAMWMASRDAVDCVRNVSGEQATLSLSFQD